MPGRLRGARTFAHPHGQPNGSQGERPDPWTPYEVRLTYLRTCQAGAPAPCRKQPHMSNARATHLTRRGILAAGGALGLGAVLAACGDDDSTSNGSADETKAAAAGPWTFKDDRGTTVKLDRIPA